MEKEEIKKRYLRNYKAIIAFAGAFSYVALAIISWKIAVCVYLIDLANRARLVTIKDIDP